MKIKTIKSLVDEAMQIVTTIEPKEAKTLLELDNHLLIDIRDIRAVSYTHLTLPTNREV